MGSLLLFLSSFIKKPATMKGLAVLALVVLAVAITAQPVYDESKRIHCPYFFPDTKNYVSGRLNETIHNMEGAYFGIRAGVYAALDKVVAAQAAACITIGDLIASVDTTAAPSK